MSFNALDEYMDRLYAEKNIPGAAIMVYRYGKLVHSYCAGWANVEEKIPFAPDTLVNLYSCTKLCNITAAMRLVEKGLIGLDEPVARYLPEMAHMTVRQEDGNVVPAKNVMLTRHLFSMSAGVNFERQSPELERIWRETDGRPTLQQVIPALAAEPLLFEPGTRFRYGMCHDVLSAVMERVTGKTLGEILRDEVIAPIGMRDTGFRIDERQHPRKAPEYHGFDGKTSVAQKIVWREGVDMGLGPNYESGGGGLMSCAEDYGKLAAALGNGGVAENGYRVLAPESIDLLRRNQMTEQGMADFGAMGGWSKEGYGYGLGVRTLLWPERNQSLSAQGEFGWDGAQGCYFLADPQNGVGIMYVQQEAGSKWYEFHGLIRNFAYVGLLA